jgi:hypothetical protein
MSEKINNQQIHFDKLFGYAKKLRDRYLNTIATRVLFDKMNELNIVGKVGKKKANENVKIINFHKYFFGTIKEATRCYFLIELAKFFDQSKSNDSLTLYKVIKYAENTLASYSVENFQKYHKDRKIFPDLFNGYKPLSENDLNKLKNKLSKNSDKIERLKTYRDKFLAHDDIKKVSVEITKKDVSVLMKIIENAIDLLYSKLEFSENDYRNFKENPKREIDRVMESLRKQEKQRIAEIEKKYGVKVEC